MVVSGFTYFCMIGTKVSASLFSTIWLFCVMKFSLLFQKPTCFAYLFRGGIFFFSQTGSNQSQWYQSRFRRVVIHIYRPCSYSVWLSKWGTTTGCKASLMYWSPVRLPCMVTKSSLQSWEIHPKPLLNLHRKGQLAGCSLGYRLYFCVSKPSSDRRWHEAETGSRLTNGSCAISLNSNHVVLNTMPNVIVDVGLPTVDV